MCLHDYIWMDVMDAVDGWIDGWIGTLTHDFTDARVDMCFDRGI